MPVAAVAAAVGGSYKRVEKVFLILSLVFVTYIVAAFHGKTELGKRSTSDGGAS